MRLDMDCVRSILLCVEENTGLRDCCNFIDIDGVGQYIDEYEVQSYQTELSEKYGNDKLIYHVMYCIEANLLNEHEISNEQSIWIEGLSVYGHEFIDKIRDHKVWSGVKGVAAKVGAKSLETFTEIASSVITEIIKMEIAKYQLI